MTSGLGRWLGLVVATLMVVAAWCLPLGSEIEPVVDDRDLGDKVYVELAPGAKYARDFTVGAMELNGVRLYTSELAEIKGGAQITIFQGEEEVARATNPTWLRRPDSTYLDWAIKLTTEKKTKLRLELENNGVVALPIQVAEESEALALALLMPSELAFGARQGGLVGAALLVGLIGLSLVNKGRWAWAAVLIAIVVPLALAGWWFTTGELGISDWDYYFSVHENYRRIIMEYGSFPFWNPYTCGGTAGLADPEFPIISPLYILELLFGVSVGLRSALLIAVTVGALGMLTLANRLAYSVEAGVLASIAWALGSATLLKFVEGHISMFAWMWITWVLWAWLAAYRRQ